MATYECQKLSKIANRESTKHGPLGGPGPSKYGPPIFPTLKNTTENNKKIKEVN